MGLVLFFVLPPLAYHYLGVPNVFLYIFICAGVILTYYNHFSYKKEQFHEIVIDEDNNVFSIVFYHHFFRKTRITEALNDVYAGVAYRGPKSLDPGSIIIEFTTSRFRFSLGADMFNSLEDHAELIRILKNYAKE
ncbi:MAG: hypothetical protein JNL32_01820 [Candidatus Kapabacteria bacterium]|nr:hypothetical protein [Candidatus Kapabacteria bacterium]